MIININKFKQVSSFKIKKSVELKIFKKRTGKGQILKSFEALADFQSKPKV